MKHFLVVGLGRFGRAVAEALTEGGAEVIAVDSDMALVEAVRDRVAVAAQVDSVEPEALRALQATDVDGAVVAIGEDFAAEVLTVATLKELGLPAIVARANTDREKRILELVGASRVVSVEVETGQRLARSLLGTDVLDQFPLGGGYSVVLWTADGRVVGKTLAETEIASRFQLSVLGVRQGGAERPEVPLPEGYAFREGDVLILLGADARLSAFTQ